MRIVVVSLLWILAASCSSSPKPVAKVAVDPSFYSVEVLGREPAIKAFLTELLAKISETSTTNFTLETASWDTLFDGLNEGKYDAIISGMAPYNFNESTYAFSPLLVKTGPILVVQKGAYYRSLKDLQGKELGILSTSSLLLAEKNPNILLRTYESIPKMLTDLSQAKIDAALAPNLPALGYCKDLFQGSLATVSPPLNHAGLRYITLKKQEAILMRPFARALEKLEKEGTCQLLYERWNLN